MKTSPWIIFILSFLLLFILVLAYYLPKIPNNSELLYNPSHVFYFGPTGFFEGFMTNGNGYGRTDTLLFFIELIGIFVLSIVLTSTLTSISKDSNIILNIPAKYDQHFYRSIFELNISIIAFLIVGVALYLGITTRVFVSRIETIILVIATIISSYNIFYYGIFIHNRSQEAKFKQVLFSSKSKYEFLETFFIVLNFIVFSASSLSIFFICTKGFFKTDKFDLVDKVNFIYNNASYQKFTGVLAVGIILYSIVNISFMFLSIEKRSLTQKILRTAIVNTSLTQLNDSITQTNQNVKPSSFDTMKIKGKPIKFVELIPWIMSFILLLFFIILILVYGF